MTLTNVFHDTSYGMRILRRQPAFAAVAIATLAVGIGASTAIFTVVNAVLLRPLPYPDSQRLVRIWESNPARGIPRFSTSPVSFRDWQSQNTVFTHIAGYDSDQVTLTGVGDPVLLRAFRITHSFLPTLEVQPLLGRNFLPEDDLAPNDNAVIISQGLWRHRFGSDPHIIGRIIKLEQQSRTVVGVMPESVQFPAASVDIWLPTAFPEYALQNRGAKWLGIIARLKPGTSFAQAEAEMKGIAARIAVLDPAKATGWTVDMLPLHEAVVGPARQTLLTVMAAVGLVLLITCANVANLLLARGTARRGEIATRSALGASRGRLVTQMLTESVLLSLLGGLVGITLAYWITTVLLSLAKDALPRQSEVQLDTTSLLYALAISVFTGLLFGVLPALRSTSDSHSQALRNSAPGLQGGTGRNRTLSGLVISEIALTLVLLVGAGLLIRTVTALLHVDPGFDTQNTLTFRVSLPAVKYAKDEQTRQFFGNAIERIREIPDVKAATLANFVPIAGSGWWTYGVEVVGRPPVQGEEVSAYYRVVDSRFAETLRMPLLRGRFFNSEDREGAPPVAVVNESFVRRMFPDEDALGKEIKIGDTNPAPRRIIGIIADVKEDGLPEAAPPVTYLSLQQVPQSSLLFVLRSIGDPKTLLAPAREIIRSADADLPLNEVFTLDEIVAESVGERRFAATVLGFFAAVALFLAMIGIYGVMSYAVTQRTREIGVRIALGARPMQIQTLFLRDGTYVILTGVVFGLALTLAMVRLLAAMLFGVRPLDTLSFVSAAALLGLVALLASYIPARRAAKLDPMDALRYE